MRSPVTRLTVGTPFAYDGELWQVVALDGATIRARGDAGLIAVDVNELLASDSFRITLDKDTRDALTPGVLGQVQLAGGSAAAEKRIRCIYLLMTGFPNGQADAQHPEPDVQVGPQTGFTLEERIRRLAQREGAGRRTLERWLQHARQHGIEALTDRRYAGIQDPLGKCAAEVRSAILHVLSEQTNRSRSTDQEIVRQVRRLVEDRHGDTVPMPGQRTLERYVKHLRRGMGHSLSTKSRRSIANRPQRQYQPYVATRPFETVEIDSQALDLFALAEVPTDAEGADTLALHKVTLTAAIDVFTRSLVAWRFTVGDPSTQDAMLLLHDTVTPKPYDPSWGPKARWRYSIPSHMVVLSAIDSTSVDVAGVPVGKPDTVVIDNGSIFTAEAFVRACADLGISIQFSRPYTPTDKPHIERVFHTIKTQFVERLPGYKGSEPSNRGTRAEVEDRASLFIWEIERYFAEWVATIYQNRPHKGLAIPGVQRHNLTPNEAFDLGVVTSGYIPVPTSPQLGITLLEPSFRTVRDGGIEVEYLRFDSPILNAYRGRRSPFTIANGAWPIRIDRRDLSSIWFWAGDLHDPLKGEWIRVPCTAGLGDIPFSDIALGYVKGLLAESGRATGRHRKSEELRIELEAFLARVEADGPANRREARVAALDRSKVTMAAVDTLRRDKRTAKASRQRHPAVKPVAEPRITQVADAAVQQALRSIAEQGDLDTHDIGAGVELDTSRYEVE